MLSDEEREALEILKGFEPDDLVECAIYLQALEKITNIIEKQSKEIARLEARKYMLNAETGEISQIPIDNNYISKDKIKAIIEEIKSRKIANEEIKQAIIDILQSLLEKE